MWHNLGMLRNFLSCLLLTAGVLTGAAPAHATVLRGLSLTQLCDRSSTIVRGRVERTEATWRDGRIYTAVHLRVEATLAGPRSAGQTVTFWRLGGEVGHIGQRVIGAPTFRVGERVIVFLQRFRGRLFVTGMFQGKVRVLPATSTAPTRVAPAISRAAVLGTKRALRRYPALSTFESTVRQLVRTRGQRRGSRP